uniref:NADH dehydrogenase subunit 4L n=1 Tax=Ophiarachnella infernalis TaxID=2587522 RepID=A0A513X062_9ECHI|nr:NADH dehydrogenase subunit 4L [Ophiarachnella infernalis]
MNVFLFILIFSTTTALFALIYHNKFILSMIICFESILLNILIFNFLLFLFNNNSCLNSLSVFLLTLSAVEGSIGISILTLITRSFSTNNITALNTLKN